MGEGGGGSSFFSRGVYKGLVQVACRNRLYKSLHQTFVFTNVVHTDRMADCNGEFSGIDGSSIDKVIEDAIDQAIVLFDELKNNLSKQRMVWKREWIKRREFLGVTLYLLDQ